MREPRFTEDQMLEIGRARERLLDFKDKIQMYPSLEEPEPISELPDGNYTVVHIHRYVYPDKKKDKYIVKGGEEGRGGGVRIK